MNIKVTKQIAGTTLELEISDKDEKEAFARALFFADRDICFSKNADGLYCLNSADIRWNVRKAKSEKDGSTYTYIERLCGKCRARSTMGEYKDGGFFWKKWEIYVPQGEKADDSTLTVEHENGPIDTINERL